MALNLPTRRSHNSIRRIKSAQLLKAHLGLLKLALQNIGFEQMKSQINGIKHQLTLQLKQLLGSLLSFTAVNQGPQLL